MKKMLSTDDTTIAGLEAFILEAREGGAKDDDLAVPSSPTQGERYNLTFTRPGKLTVELRTGLSRVLGGRR